MRSPYRSVSSSSYTSGPGPLPPAIRFLIVVNVAVFIVDVLGRGWLLRTFGFSPALAVGSLDLWQFVTYQFLHGGFGHILFNMLALWMFGTELERTWGSQAFLKYYLVCGIGAAMTTVCFSLLPFDFADRLWNTPVIGASGAIYGVLLAFGMYFPRRPIYIYFLFPIQAKYFVMVMGGVSLLASINGGIGGGVAHTTHLGGLLAGYIFLKRGSRNRGSGIWSRFIPEMKYRYLRWKIDRARRRFDVYPGGQGRSDRIH